jgi:hypothetical protein
MKQLATNLSRFSLLLLTATLANAGSAYAGPPLICHAISIGNARSLPWTSDNLNLAAAQNYDTKNLVSDTLAILTPTTPVLVRMETLRRATLYARSNSQAAKELLTRLYARAADSDRAGHPDAMAWFDAGYLVECYRQWIGQNLPHMTDGLRMDPNPAANLDGYAWVTRAIGLRGSDAEMEFAAALISLTAPHKNDLRGHAERARAGAPSDPLLAENLSIRFVGNRGETIAEMFSEVPTPKN